MTAASGDFPYCTPQQLTARFDERSVRQLLSDTDAPVTGSLSDNATLAALLRDASGEVESAACAGQRYVISESRNDLASLTGNSAEFLAGLVAGLAYFKLWSRRPNSEQQLPAAVTKSLDWLEQLRLGERVFGVLENHQAAALDSVADRASDVVARNGPAVIAERFFGRRANRLRPD